MIAATIHLFACMLVFTLVERLWPSSRPHSWWRRPFLVDVCSWLTLPVAIGSGIMLAVWSTRALLREPLWPWLEWLQSATNHLPLLLNVLIAFVAVDFFNYWLHRAYHHFPFLWSFHVMHHSSERIDWLSTLRVHPISQMIDTAMVTACLLTIGLPLNALVAAHALIGFSAVVTHANVPWTFGRFGSFFVSPIFHHWHHARTEPDSGTEPTTNFGAAMCIWDRIFGTSRDAKEQPAGYGTERSSGKSFISLLLYPLRFCFRGKRDTDA
jgi:sterol desaturase/sphingolipid hydroxylase (fatty acid hydroxylase superfamily)